MSSAPNARITLGYEARREGRLEDAKQLFAKAVESSRGVANQALLAKSLTGLGQIERDLKDNAQALQHYGEAASIYRGLPDPLRLAHAIRHVGDILRSEGSIEQARPCYEEALKIYREQMETSHLDLANAIRGLRCSERTLMRRNRRGPSGGKLEVCTALLRCSPVCKRATLRSSVWPRRAPFELHPPLRNVVKSSNGPRPGTNFARSTRALIFNIGGKSGVVESCRKAVEYGL